MAASRGRTQPENRFDDIRETQRRTTMPSGDKSSYTEKQKRQAGHIEQSYEQRGVSEKNAGKRAWATVNKLSGGGKKKRLGPEKRLT
jgi:hypothetical protein